MDALYKKYRNSDTIAIFTPYGELNGKVIIEKNDKGLPVSVCIYGNSPNEDAVTEFLVNTVKMKLKQGYKRPVGNAISEVFAEDILDKNSFWEMISMSSRSSEFGRKTLFKKGSMYFKLDAVKSQEKNSEFPSITKTDCYWRIETGDSKQKGGSSATKFEF